MVAAGPWMRWRGIRAVPPSWGLLLAAERVHGRGLAEPIRLVGVSADGAVLRSTVLLPGAFASIDGAVFIVELPLSAPVPTDRSAIVLTPMVAR